MTIPISVTIRQVFGQERDPLKAVVSVSIDNALAIHELRLIQRNDGSFFVAMPSVRRASGRWKDIVHPIGTEFRQVLEEKVVSAYMTVIQEQMMHEKDPAE